MKKFIPIILAITTMFIASCGVANKVDTNSQYEATGEYRANDKDAAWQAAYTNAVAKVISRAGSNLNVDSQSTYEQVQTGQRGSDSGKTTMKIRRLSDGSVFDVVVVKEKELSWWKLGPFSYGYEVTVRVNPNNVKIELQ